VGLLRRKNGSKQNDAEKPWCGMCGRGVITGADGRCRLGHVVATPTRLLDADADAPAPEGVDVVAGPLVDGAAAGNLDETLRLEPPAGDFDPYEVFEVDGWEPPSTGAGPADHADTEPLAPVDDLLAWQNAPEDELTVVARPPASSLDAFDGSSLHDLDGSSLDDLGGFDGFDGFDAFEAELVAPAGDEADAGLPADDFLSDLAPVSPERSDRRPFDGHEEDEATMEAEDRRFARRRTAAMLGGSALATMALAGTTLLAL
jgi:hypothetical protein